MNKQKPPRNRKPAYRKPGRNFSVGTLLNRFQKRVLGLFENGYAAVPMACFIHLLILLLFIPTNASAPEPKNIQKKKEMAFLKRVMKNNADASGPDDRNTPGTPDPTGEEETKNDSENTAAIESPSKNSKNAEKQNEKNNTQTQIQAANNKPDPGSARDNADSTSPSKHRPEPPENEEDKPIDLAPESRNEKEEEKGNGSDREQEKLSRWEKHLREVEEELKKKAEDSPLSTRKKARDEGEKGKTQQSYFTKLSLHLGEYFSMPRVVRFQQLKDTVIVQIRVLRDGTIKMDRMVRRSRHPELNQAARNTIQKAGSFQKPPLGPTDKKAMTVRVKFRFQPRPDDR